MEDKEFEEQSFESTIPVEEDEAPADGAEKGSEEQIWEEFVVAGEELVSFVRELVHEVTVRRIVVKNEEKRILLELPLVLGVAGIAMLPMYSALALIAALVSECTILVERVEKAPSEEASGEAAEG